MSLLSLLSALLFAIQAHGYALPNPQAAATTARAVRTTTASADRSVITGSTFLPQSDWDAYQSYFGDYSLNSAQLASESAAYKSYSKHFVETAEPSVLSAIASRDREDSLAWESWTAELYETATADSFTTIGSAQLASDSAAWFSYTKELYATIDSTALAALQSYRSAEASAFAAWTSELYETIGSAEYKSLTAEWAQWSAEDAIYATYTETGIPPGITLDPVDRADSSQTAIDSNGVVRDNTAGTTTQAGPAVAQQTFGPLSRTQSTPGAYSLTCLDSNSSDLSNHAIAFSSCSQVMIDICNHLTDPSKIITEQWVWNSNSNSHGTCAMGYWVPLIGEAKMPAAIPSAEECRMNIFDKMARTCVPVSDGQNGQWNAASVNIAQVPGADNSGQQVDAGKISFMLAGSPYPCGSKGCATAPTVPSTA